MQDPQAEDPQEVTYTQLDHRIFMQKNTTPTSQRPGEPLHDESVYMELATGWDQSRHKSYAPRTHKKTLRRLSIDAIALSEHTPTQQQPESEDRSLHLPLILRRNNNLRKPPIPSRILLWWSRHFQYCPQNHLSFSRVSSDFCCYVI